MGAVTLTEKFNLTGYPDEGSLEDCVKYIQKKFNDVEWIHDIDVPLIGIGGTARAFAKMDQRAIQYDISKIHNYILPYDHFLDLCKTILSGNSSSRKKISGLNQDRADLIIAGAAVIKALYDITGSEEMIVSGNGLREGLFYEFYSNYCDLRTPHIADILDFSIENFIGTLSNYNKAHCDQVRRIADMLFDKLQAFHGYGPRERMLLDTAARLHDVGKMINFYDHARHSAFIIGHAPLYGLTQEEQLKTSFIAGFHHGISRRIMRAYRYSNMISEEDWVMVRKLSTLLALAEASDLTYEQIVTDITATVAENVIVLVITTTPGATYNAADYEMKQLVKQFKKEFGATMLLVWK